MNHTSKFLLGLSTAFYVLFSPGHAMQGTDEDNRAPSALTLAQPQALRLANDFTSNLPKAKRLAGIAFYLNEFFQFFTGFTPDLIRLTASYCTPDQALLRKTISDLYEQDHQGAFQCNLDHLDFSVCGLNNDDIDFWVNLHRQRMAGVTPQYGPFREVRTLNLSCNNLHYADAAKLLHCFDNRMVERLNLSRNPIGPGLGKDFPLLPQPLPLLFLDLSYTDRETRSCILSLKNNRNGWFPSILLLHGNN